MPALRSLRQPRLAVALLAALVAGVPGTARAQAAATPDTARVRIVSIPGSLPAARNAVVVLPTGYHESLRRYPVLYLLHGHDGGHRNWLDRTNLLAHTARLPLIVVLPDAGNSWYTNSFARPAEKFEEYVAREIPAFIDQNFRTLTYREARYVAGLSMGGYGALKLGLKYPGRFSLAGSFSASPLAAANTGSQTLMDAFGPEGSAARTENDLVALAGAASVADAPYFYIDIGIADRLVGGNRTLVQAMQARGLAYEYHEVPGAHTWEFWDRRLPVFLRLVEERIARLPSAASSAAYLLPWEVRAVPRAGRRPPPLCGTVRDGFHERCAF
jgi:putative tributyrin esterase